MIDNTSAVSIMYNMGTCNPAKEIIRMKKVYCRKKKTTVWWTKEVKDSVKMKMNAF